jgi:N-acyl-D-amino-acid deacylase
MFDVIVSSGTLIDGTGSPKYESDVGISGDKVTAIGDLSQASAKRTIDATGLVVAPGLIDSHVHSDGVLLINPQHANGLRQGVTTEILGQDGLSYAPLSQKNYRTYRRYLIGILGEPPEELDMSSVQSFRSHYHKKTAVNTAYLVAHGAVRLETLGFQDVPMTGQSLKKACAMVKQGMEEGAVGFATGLSYHPQAWSDTDELIALCEAATELDGVYVTHLRDVNTDRAFGGGGIPEALEIGKRSGVKVHFSHTRTTEQNAGRVGEVLELIDKSKDQVDTTLELYPYPTGSTFCTSLLPSYAHRGGPEEIIKKLNDPLERKKMGKYMEENTVKSADQAILSSVPKRKHLEGMSMIAVAEEMKLPVGEALCQLLLEEDLQVGFWGTPPANVSTWRQISKDALTFLSRPDYMVGSDSIPVGGHPHPRAYGTFPRFLGRLRRQFGILSLEQMIQRMTQNPAKRFGLKGRGVLKKGNFADIIIFDQHKIIDTATYDDPHQFPAGIPYVLVNGMVAVDQEHCTGILAGHAIP